MKNEPVERASMLSSILEGNLCLGCGLCASLSDGKLGMAISDDGYLRPTTEGVLSEDLDATIARVCPGIQLNQDNSEGESHPIWGPLVRVRIGASTDSKLRHHASSGGALSGLLTYLLEEGVVDRVLHVAASDYSPLENAAVLSRDNDDVYKAAGSRYAPSAPLSKLMEELNKPGRFALVGKPCDIAGARNLALEDSRIDEKVPVMLSFFCAGVPSLQGARAVLEKLGVGESSVERFRYRDDGWPGEATAVLRDGSRHSMSYADSWGDILSKYVQMRCKICPDGSGGSADIVCADAWECDENGYPLFEEADGRSLIVTRTSKGEALVCAAIEARKLEASDLETDQIAKMQPSQVNRKQAIVSRLAALRLLGRITPNYSGYRLWRAAGGASLLSQLRNFVGMGRRILSGRH